mmetsp:Transcript_17209/g.49782  ORF Transcript_17209/g.49782 Transcript_17209/m.49782 type:complete len:254 (-) Transcript_17209:145-906(-)
MASIVIPTGSVNCGGSVAANCAACPNGHGALWCNGDCVWISGFLDAGKCELKGLMGMPSAGTNPNADFYWYAASFWVSAVVLVAYACIYKKKVVDKIPELAGAHIASNELSLFVCFTKLHTCLQVAFCMPVVMAKNYNAAQVMEFWPSCIFSFLLTYTPLWPVGVIVRAVLAKKVQDEIGHETTLVKTCCKNLFCMPCDVGRESEEIDDEVGAEIKCCCKVTVTPRLINEVDDVKSRMCDDRFGKNRMCGGGS